MEEWQFQQWKKLTRFFHKKSISKLHWPGGIDSAL